MCNNLYCMHIPKPILIYYIDIACMEGSIKSILIFARLIVIFPFSSAFFPGGRRVGGGRVSTDLRKYLHSLSLQLIAGNQETQGTCHFFLENTSGSGQDFPLPPLEPIKMRPHQWNYSVVVLMENQNRTASETYEPLIHTATTSTSPTILTKVSLAWIIPLNTIKNIFRRRH